MHAVETLDGGEGRLRFVAQNEDFAARVVRGFHLSPLAGRGRIASIRWLRSASHLSHLDNDSAGARCRTAHLVDQLSKSGLCRFGRQAHVGELAFGHGVRKPFELEQDNRETRGIRGRAAHAL